MRRPLAMRQVVLAGMTLLGVVASLAYSTRHGHHSAAAALPPASGSYTALVAATGPAAIGKKTTCGVVIEGSTMGISSPVLPCGIRLYVTYKGRHVLASVIDRASVPGAELLLTPALGRHLGVTGIRRVQWSYAGAA